MIPAEVHQVKHELRKLCASAVLSGISPKSPDSTMLHGLPDSLQLATTPAWTRDWAAGHCQAETGCWLILDANQLLKGLEFMRWRNSTLWQCRRTGSVLLRLPADSSCEERIHSCFSTTAKGNFHMLLFNFCIWLWYAFFWGLPHRAHSSDTSLSKSSDDKPKVLGSPQYFPYMRFHFGSDILILRGDEFLRGFTGSLFTQSEDVGLLWEPIPWSIPSHVGWRQMHKPQLQTGTSTELGMFGSYFDWSLIISHILHDVLPKSQRQTPSKISVAVGRRCDTSQIKSIFYLQNII